MITFALGLILGVLAGYYARTIYNMLKTFYDDYTERKMVKETGVIRPVGRQVTKNQPINLESETGGVIRLSPNQVAIQNLREREQKLKSYE